MKVDAGNAGVGQLLGELAGLMLGAHEQDPATTPRGECEDDALLGVLPGDLEDVVGHRGYVRGGLVDRVHDRLVQETLDQLVDTVVEGGREQQSLSALGGGGEDAGDAGKESQVGHVVGLVEDGDLDAVQTDQTLAHEVFEAARAGHDDVHSGAQRGGLTTLRYATENGRHGESEGRGHRLHDSGDLGRQFAGGRQDQSAGAAGSCGASRRQTGDQRNGESEGLATTRLSATEYVATGETVGQRVGLDGERGGDAAGGEHLDQARGNAEVGESR